MQTICRWDWAGAWWGRTWQRHLQVPVPGASLFSTTYTLQIFRKVDLRQAHTKRSCWLYWDLPGGINAVHQSHSHSSPSCPSDTGVEDFLDTSTKDPSNFPTFRSSPLIPSLYHACRFSSLPCHPATASGTSSSVMFSPPGLSRLQTLSLRVFLCGLVEKVMWLPPSMLQSGGMWSSSSSEVQLCQTGSTCLRVVVPALGFAFQGRRYGLFFKHNRKVFIYTEGCI